MKYMTKEWMLKNRLTSAYRLVRESERAEKFDEDFYRQVSEQLFDKYLINEREFNRRPNPLTEEQMCNRVRRELTNRQRLFEYLPQEIRDRIADLRVCATGFASAEVIALLKPFCENLKAECDAVKDRAHAETDDAESFLAEPQNFNECGEMFLLEILQEGGDVYLVFDFGETLRIKNAEIVERESDTIYPFDEKIADSGWSLVLETELHRVGDLFEVHFLIENLDRSDEREWWYLTVRGTDLKTIPTSKLKKRQA